MILHVSIILHMTTDHGHRYLKLEHVLEWGGGGLKFKQIFFHK